MSLGSRRRDGPRGRGSGRPAAPVGARPRRGRAPRPARRPPPLGAGLPRRRDRPAPRRPRGAGGAAWATLAAMGLAARGGGPVRGAAWAPLFLALALIAAGAGLVGRAGRAGRGAGAGVPLLRAGRGADRGDRPLRLRLAAPDARPRGARGHRPRTAPPSGCGSPCRATSAGSVPEPGRVVMLTGHLSPPSGPSEPGAFDFRRQAWFEQLGAVGYTSNPVLTRSAPEGGLWIHRLRAWLSLGLRSRIAGDDGGLAAAVTTGDRSGLSQAANQTMRDSGLYHIVSISGMHMALLVGLRLRRSAHGLALVPPLALRVAARRSRRWRRFPLPPSTCARGPGRGDRAGVHHGRGDAGRDPARPAGAVARGRSRSRRRRRWSSGPRAW